MSDLPIPEEWQADPTDPEGIGLSRPYIPVGAILGSDENVMRSVMPHPLTGEVGDR